MKAGESPTNPDTLAHFVLVSEKTRGPVVLKSTSPLARGLIAFRVGVWLFSYVLFFVMLAGSGAVRGDMPLYLAMLALVGMGLSGVTEAAVNRSRGFATVPRLVIVAAAIILVTVVNAGIDVATLGRSMAPQRPHTVSFFFLNGLASFTYLVWIHAFYAACVWLVGASAELVDKERRLAEAETEAQRATLQALRSQVNPHFLFNALNAAASLVATRRNEQAEELIVRLSEFFRSSLSGDRPAMISLNEEFEMLDAYLQIELIRFPGKLEVAMDCPPELEDVPAPRFLLLPLVENAIKHAVAHTTAPTLVRVAASTDTGRLQLTVENEAEQSIAPVQSQGEGVGLRNVSQRLQVMYGPEATMEAGPTGRGFRVRIELPLTRALPP